MLHFIIKASLLLTISAISAISAISFADQQNRVAPITAGGMKPVIVTTTSLMRDLVTHLCGSDVDVESLMGPGTDPHLYKVTPGDIRKLARADIIIYHGLHLEGRMAEALESYAKRKLTIPATEVIAKNNLRLSAEGIPDPHVWFDVSLWRTVTLELAKTLAKALPELETRILKAGDNYAAKLGALDEEILARIKTIPESQRVLITAHDAFGYFGKRYNIKVLGVQGVSTDSEAGLRHVQELIDLIVASRIKAVFMETSVGERSVRALVDGAASRGQQVALSGPLYSDALGESGTAAADFAGMIRHNVNTIVAALGGKVSDAN